MISKTNFRRKVKKKGLELKGGYIILMMLFKVCYLQVISPFSL
jgi:hypothetical protein